ncbi:YihY/virulence factor BrkB family protein [Virgibacillus sp. YIM 98842]|uniref:YihY/virulence factor BrkB family protein n=1 Tax=Virgibacillus sp. YIM 98842 TaxID=2663533 RepID=UPI0013DA253C|nr:YihY/virulence factor BrkB family protein [Virgibacillus sp. YIM 98842]
MKRIVNIGLQLYERIEKVDVFGLAAQLAYFFLLSLFPFLLVLVTLVGFLPFDDIAVVEFINRYAPDQISDLIESNVQQLMHQQSGGLLSIGIIVTLWSASNGVNALMRGFNRAYEVEENRSFIVSRLIAVVLTIGMIIVIITALLLPVFGRMIGVYLFSFFGLSEGFITVWESVRYITSSVVFFVVFLALYVLAPNKRIYFKNAIWGAVFATVFWQLTSLAFSFYVNTLGNYSATYGSLGTVIVLMLWFYISAIIIMLGGLINAFIREKSA